MIAKLTVSDVMTHDPYTVTPFTPMQQAAHSMLEHKISGLPVVRKGETCRHHNRNGHVQDAYEHWDSYMARHANAVLMYSSIGAEAHP